MFGNGNDDGDSDGNDSDSGIVIQMPADSEIEQPTPSGDRSELTGAETPLSGSTEDGEGADIDPADIERAVRRIAEGKEAAPETIQIEAYRKIAVRIAEEIGVDDPEAFVDETYNDAMRAVWEEMSGEDLAAQSSAGEEDDPDSRLTGTGTDRNVGGHGEEEGAHERFVARANALDTETVQAAVTGQIDTSDIDEDELIAGINRVFGDSTEDYGTGIEGGGRGGGSMNPQQALRAARFSDEAMNVDDDPEDYDSGIESARSGRDRKSRFTPGGHRRESGRSDLSLQAEELSRRERAESTPIDEYGTGIEDREGEDE